MARPEAPRIAITMGDPTGIGPEIIVKVLSLRGTLPFCRPVVLGDRMIMERAIRLLNAPITIHEMETADERHYRHDSLNLVSLSAIPPEEARYGTPGPSCGRAMATYIEEAVKLVMQVGSTPSPPLPSVRRRFPIQDTPTPGILNYWPD